MWSSTFEMGVIKTSVKWKLKGNSDLDSSNYDRSQIDPDSLWESAQMRLDRSQTCLDRYQFAFVRSHYVAFGIVHTKIDLSLDRSEIDFSSLWESVHTHLDRSWIELSLHFSAHIQIALDLDRSQIGLTH